MTSSMLSTVTVSSISTVRQGDPREEDMSDDEEGSGVEDTGPLEEEDAFYPDSSQWEAEEEEETKLPPAPSAITEKVTSSVSSVLLDTVK